MPLYSGCDERDGGVGGCTLGTSRDHAALSRHSSLITPADRDNIDAIVAATYSLALQSRVSVAELTTPVDNTAESLIDSH